MTEPTERGGDSGRDPSAVPGVYPTTTPGPDDAVTLEVDGEVFLVRTTGRGSYGYTWASGPNDGYGFGLSGPPVGSLEEHRTHIRGFLAGIDPDTGFLAED